jgi:glycosyltransferase involved in cell wall biosynthesis
MSSRLDAPAKEPGALPVVKAERSASQGELVKVTIFHLGFSEYVMGLANALAQAADVEVIHPLNLDKVCSSIANENVKLTSFSKPCLRRDPRNLAAIKRAFDLIKSSRPDILHVQESFDYAYDLYSVFASMPPLVTTIHDVVPHPGDGHAAPGLQYTKAVSCWRSSRLIVHTDKMRLQLAKRFHVRSDKIDVIPHGELGSLYRDIARAYGIPVEQRDPHTLLFFGRIWPYKGLRYLLEAFSLVKREIPEARLVIAGKGGDLAANGATIRSLTGIEVIDRYIPEELIASLFERSSLVVLPYVEASQSGVAAIGYSMGTVVVASNVGGFAEFIQDQVTGILVEPRCPSSIAAAIIMLLKDQEKQSRIRENAQALAESTISWETIAQQTLTTYDNVLCRCRNIGKGGDILA